MLPYILFVFRDNIGKLFMRGFKMILCGNTMSVLKLHLKNGRILNAFVALGNVGVSECRYIIT